MNTDSAPQKRRRLRRIRRTLETRARKRNKTRRRRVSTTESIQHAYLDVDMCFVGLEEPEDVDQSETGGLRRDVLICGDSRRRRILWGCPVGGVGPNTYHPKKVENLRDCCKIAAGSFHVLAMTKDGTVYSWGHGEYGQLGHQNGTSDATERLKL